MENKFNAGETAYIVTNNRNIEKVTVVKTGGGFYTVRFENGGGTRLRESRLFKTEDEAKSGIR